MGIYYNLYNLKINETNTKNDFLFNIYTLLIKKIKNIKITVKKFNCNKYKKYIITYLQI